MNSTRNGEATTSVSRLDPYDPNSLRLATDRHAELQKQIETTKQSASTRPPRKSLTDIVSAVDRESLARAWGSTEAAKEFAPLPAGSYVATVVSGELAESRSKRTPEYKLCFRVTEGEFAGRQLWLDLFLTPAALPMTKRDLAKLGLTSLEQLERPLPPGIRCRLQVVVRRDDDGVERNRIRTFECLGAEPPDPFAPKAEGGDQ